MSLLEKISTPDEIRVIYNSNDATADYTDESPIRELDGIKWLQRLELYKETQAKVTYLQRVKTLAGIAFSSSLAIVLFVLLSQILIPMYALIFLIGVFALSAAIYLISALFYRFSLHRIDALKTAFFNANRELDALENALTLVDRRSNRIVAAISL
jgi:hypothetical protein